MNIRIRSIGMVALMMTTSAAYADGHISVNINPFVYSWLLTYPCLYFNDITGHGKLQQAATNNGLFPTTPRYDEATGIGSPKFATIITG